MPHYAQSAQKQKGFYSGFCYLHLMHCVQMQHSQQFMTNMLAVDFYQYARDKAIR